MIVVNNLMRFALSFGVFTIGVLQAVPAVADARLELIWSLDNVFEMPESAAFDPDRQVVYVSNVNGYARDGNGYISRISADGVNAELRWLTGLNSPTGVAVSGNRLYFADYDALVVVDLGSETVIGRYPAPDAADDPALNDVAVAGDGTVYVTGSRSRTIYRWKGAALEVWIKDEQLLEGANGLLVVDNILVHGGLYWNAFDRGTGEATAAPVQPPESLSDFDGIAGDGEGGYLVTLIEDSRIWRIAPGGKAAPLSEMKLDGIDLDFDAGRGLIYLPRVGGSLSVYRVLGINK